MTRYFTRLAAIVVLLSVGAGAVGREPRVVISVERPKPEKPHAAPFEGNRPSVDVAILLDTSNSMDGLISQAKSQLWMIVQQFAKAKKRGQTPVLRVALFEYGNTRLPASEGYIRQVVPLTDDLDKLSECLFGLSTNGGDEYCGQVIDEAIKRLDWSREAGGYKAIFIAGNEPFTQGPVNYADACKKAIEKGIVVNTIHCGNHATGVDGQWQHGAKLAEGEFFNIDQDRAVVHIDCPQDEIIIKLNAELNKTYLWYGTREERDGYAANQAAQDANAQQAGKAVAAARGAIKAGGLYSNVKRDLVDTLEVDKTILSKLKRDELPAELQDLAPAAREAKVQEVARQRRELQAKIQELAQQREAYLAKEQQRLAEQSGQATLGDAVVATLNKQLAKSGFETGEK